MSERTSKVLRARERRRLLQAQKLVSERDRIRRKDNIEGTSCQPTSD
jgi:hypothetical protein